MNKTMMFAVLAFLAGGIGGALLLNQRSIASQELLVPVVQEPASQPPRDPDRPNRGANANPFQPARQPQPARGPTGSPMQLTATGKFVYILRGNEILQFQAESLDFVKKVNVPPQERRDPPPPPPVVPPIEN